MIIADGADIAESETAAILQSFEGKVIKPTKREDGRISWDVLGTDMTVDLKNKSVLFNSETYITKLEQKFYPGPSPSKRIKTPEIDERAIVEEQENDAEPAVQFDFRSLLGGLGWCAMCSRPDICMQVSILSRYANKKFTKSLVAGGLKVLRYLISTKSTGLYWDPQQERRFDDLVAEIIADAREKRLGPTLDDSAPRVTVWSDASFAVHGDMKSHTGIVVYYRGLPVAWRSKKQSMLADSTCSSEYIAVSDARSFMDGQMWTDFLGGCDNYLYFNDNQACVGISKLDSTQLKPKSRHLSLRLYRVKEIADKLSWAPTHAMRADALTKNSVPQWVRENIFLPLSIKETEKLHEAAKKAKKKELLKETAFYVEGEEDSVSDITASDESGDECYEEGVDVVEEVENCYLMFLISSRPI